MAVVIDLVPHLDAGDRSTWQGDQNERPLTALGRRQAEALAEALAVEPVDALYSSPALRCRQTLQPLADRLSLDITILAELGEDAWRVPDGWSLGPGGAAGGFASAFAAGGVQAAVERMRSAHAAGHVVACSHGHTIPAFVAFLVGAHGLDGVPELFAASYQTVGSVRGQWYRVRIDGERVTVELRQAPEPFPR